MLLPQKSQQTQEQGGNLCSEYFLCQTSRLNFQRNQFQHRRTHSVDTLICHIMVWDLCRVRCVDKMLRVVWTERISECLLVQVTCDYPDVLCAVHALLVRLTENHPCFVLVKVPDDDSGPMFLQVKNKQRWCLFHERSSWRMAEAMFEATTNRRKTQNKNRNQTKERDIKKDLNDHEIGKLSWQQWTILHCKKHFCFLTKQCQNETPTRRRDDNFVKSISSRKWKCVLACRPRCSPLFTDTNCVGESTGEISLRE